MANKKEWRAKTMVNCLGFVKIKKSKRKKME